MITDQNIESPKIVGDHFFEDWCTACGAAQVAGPCSVCPHLPMTLIAREDGSLGYAKNDTSREHYARLACEACGKYALRGVRVKAPL